MPAFVSGLTPAPFLPSLLGQVYKKAFIILLVLFVFLFFSYLPLKLSLTPSSEQMYLNSITEMIAAGYYYC